MHQKWYTAYDEAIRVPLIIYNKKLFPKPRSVDALTSHIDLLPTLLGLAGIDPEPLRQELAQDHSDALPLVGRNLAPLVLGAVNQASVNAPPLPGRPIPKTTSATSSPIQITTKPNIGRALYDVLRRNTLTRRSINMLHPKRDFCREQGGQPRFHRMERPDTADIRQAEATRVSKIVDRV